MPCKETLHIIKLAKDKMFTTNFEDIITQIDAIDPIEYGKTRNYINGAVTKLSPYISRGVISTKFIARQVLKKGYSHNEIEPFLKELAWRDYFQQVWIALKDDINNDIKQPQPNVTNNNISNNIINTNTGITAIDNAITELYNTGYMHNHLRMYVASMSCNIAKSHWQMPAKWMYYHLLDADWASNACSWQWVAGSFSNKKYFANQENINKYCNTTQQNTFLDIDYDAFDTMPIPQQLKQLVYLHFTTTLPKKQTISINNQLPTYIYNFYNLDFNWNTTIKANRILLLEPSFYKKYPTSKKTIDFIIALSANIDGLQIFVSEFSELATEYNIKNIHYKEHPTNNHYTGTIHTRDWMFQDVQGYFPSFFAYWKQCSKQINTLLP